ncbi:hypothetical protein ACIBKX_00365 [Streptomyces sp. NPDC050658]|uniref:hypothetical protein n=1 Tax=unclassified Streptomyces TaxID=2593676 RepID=UPI00341782F3
MTEHHLAEVRHLVSGGHGGKRKASAVVLAVVVCALLGATAALVGALVALLVEGTAARLATWGVAASVTAVSAGLWWGSAELRNDRRQADRVAARAPRPGGRR